MTSVTVLLEQRHGTVARAGSKVECPKCRHETFSIKADDSLGKCFHPECGWFLSAGGGAPSVWGDIADALQGVYEDFHRALVETPTSDAHQYLEQRGIHPRVIASSMVGVVTRSYDLRPRFLPGIDRVQDRINQARLKPKGPGRPPKNDGPNLEEHLVALTEARDDLADVLRRCEGWLAFFYTDAKHRVVAIRFRRPNSKDFTCFKPLQAMGVFNREVSQAPVGPFLSLQENELLICEGEFNQLQLQSLLARLAESQGLEPEVAFVQACAVGGAGTADAETIRRTGMRPVVCYDNDASGAGFKLVEAVRQVRAVSVFTTPALGSDLDEHLRSYASRDQEALESLLALMSEREVLMRPYEAVREEIDAWRRTRRKEFEVNREAADIAIRDLKERGCFYREDQRTYLFLVEEKVLLPIGEDGSELNLVLNRYGLAPTEKVHRYVVDQLCFEALTNGAPTSVHVFSHYNQDAGVLYVFDLGHQVYRVTATSIEKVDNGTDGVLFQRDSNATPFVIGPHDLSSSALSEALLDSVSFKADELTPAEKKLLFLVWFYSLFFPELFPTKALLGLIGGKGSGKTSLGRKVGKLLFGDGFNVMQLSSDEKDFDAAVTNQHLVVVDNADTDVKWLNDRLAVVGTGGSIQRRQLYSTNELVRFQVRASLILTARTPQFRRDDVVDRLLVLHMDRMEHFQPESKLVADLLRKRSAIMTEVVSHLQAIVGGLHAQRHQVHETEFRLADFADFALKVADVQGFGAAMKTILNKLVRAQAAFTLEGDPFYEALMHWLGAADGKNVGREVTASVLASELAQAADLNAVPLKERSGSAIAQKLRNLKSNLACFMDINETAGRSNLTHYSFSLKVETQAGGVSASG